MPAKKVVTQTELTFIEGWENLSAEEQGTVRDETQAARTALISEGQSRLTVGEHLIAIRDILEPKKMWTSYLRTTFHMSVATAFRYIKYFEVNAKRLPKPVFAVALEMGYSLPAKAIESTNPPKTDDREKIMQYLDRINKPAPKSQPAESNPDELMKSCIHFVGLQFSKLPKNSRIRGNFARNLIGMEMTVFGMGNEQSFAPVGIPENFRVVRGRPRKIPASSVGASAA